MRPGNDQVVDDRYIQGDADVREISGEFDVRGARLGTVRRVVVGKQQVARTGGQSRRYDRAVAAPDAAA